jgi:hypothetical protein
MWQRSVSERRELHLAQRTERTMMRHLSTTRGTLAGGAAW